MISTHRPILFRSSALLAFGLVFASPASVWPQTIVTTVPVAGSAALVVNTVTNKIYVVGGLGVTVIDGTTHTPTTLQTPAGAQPI